MTLPGTPPPTLQALLSELTAPQRAALVAHLIGGTSADWISNTLRDFGHSVSATTIRTYRRSLKEV